MPGSMEWVYVAWTGPSNQWLGGAGTLVMLWGPWEIYPALLEGRCHQGSNHIGSHIGKAHYRTHHPPFLLFSCFVCYCDKQKSHTAFLWCSHFSCDTLLTWLQCTGEHPLCGGSLNPKQQNNWYLTWISEAVLRIKPVASTTVLSPDPKTIIYPSCWIQSFGGWFYFTFTFV